MTRPYDEWADSQNRADVTVDGHDLEVAYYEAGEEGADPPIVLLHGIPTNSFLWRHVVDALTEERRVIAPDMVGYGNSSMRDGFDRSIRTQEAMIDSLFDTLGLDAVSLVGHDLGGGVFLRFAAHQPDRVERLVLSNAVAYDSWPIQFITDMGLPETARETDVDELQETLDEMLRGTLYGDEVDEAFVEGMKAPWASEQGVTSLVRDAVATNTSHTTEIDPTAVTAETLLLWGAEDEFQPVEYAERLEDDVDDAELVGLEEANHWVPEDRPEAYRERLVEFLLD